MKDSMDDLYKLMGKVSLMEKDAAAQGKAMDAQASKMHGAVQAKIEVQSGLTKKGHQNADVALLALLKNRRKL